MYHRYANPLELLQQMLEVGQLNRFITEIGQIVWQEKADNQRWDFWVHRVFDMEFSEYVQLCENSMQQAETSDNVDLGETIRNSFEMLENFQPE